MMSAPVTSSSPSSPNAASNAFRREQEALAWATLDAFKVLGRAGAQIATEGGPVEWMRKDPLALLELRDASRLRAVAEPRLPVHDDARREAVRSLIGVARKKAALLRPFLEQGGEVLGGPATGRLARASSPPLCAYAVGASELLERIDHTPTVAIVGTRQATEAGLLRAEKWAKVLAQHGVIVVSGGALGIDCAAHRGAIRGGGATVAVLGESVRAPKSQGLTRPRRVEEVFATTNHAARTLSLTVNGPWVPTGRQAFVSRNRLVAALVDAVIVVEAAEGSGALYTVSDAKALGLPVYAVPGDPDCPQAAATNRLIANGSATMLVDAYALLDKLGVGHRNVAPETPPALGPALDPGPPLLQCIRASAGGLFVDDAAKILGVSAAEVLREALTLELEGRITREGGVLRAVKD